MSQLEAPHRPGLMHRIRNYLLTGLLVLAPTAVTLWVFFRLLNWVDLLLGRYMRFEQLDYRRIPGAGLLATLILLTIVGWITSWIGTRSIAANWDRLLSRIPGFGILYGSTKSLGEAFLTNRQDVFRQVVLVQWPHPGSWRVGFVTGRAGDDVSRSIGKDVEVVFVPHTPNPASGFVHYVPKAELHYLDWQVEDGLKMIVSGGVVQPPPAPAPEG